MIPVFIVTIVLLIFCATSAFNFLARYFYSHCKLVLGTLYPAYKCYKAIKKKDNKEYTRWMMYWVCYGIFSAVEFFTDFLVAFWFPFYYEGKILFLIWLMNPYGNGAKVFYKAVIHPELNRHEETIDSYINKATIFSFTGFHHLWRNFSEPLTNALAYGLSQVLFKDALSEIGTEIEKDVGGVGKEMIGTKETMINEPAKEMDIETIIEQVIESGKENINESNIKENLSRENGRLRPKRERKITVK